MMKAIVMFYENSLRVILDSQKRSEAKISMAQIEMFLSREEHGAVMEEITGMKFIDPATPTDELKRKFDDIHANISKAYNEFASQGMRI